MKSYVMNHVYIKVMEFCNNGDLADYLASNGTINESVIRHFFTQIGLNFCIIIVQN